MGMRFHSYIFYGFEIKNERDDFYELMEETWEPDSKVIIDTAGDGEPYFICVRESYMMASVYDGDSRFTPLPMGNLSNWDYELYQFCLENNLQYSQPCWIFATGYS